LKIKGLDRAKGYAHNSSMRIGYARVSRDDQNPQYQHDALSTAGCARIFEDRNSGAEFSRAWLDQALAVLESGGVLVVWKLDRLGRSMLDTVNIVLDLDKRGVGFLSLTERLKSRKILNLFKHLVKLFKGFIGRLLEGLIIEIIIRHFLN
jgi:DNA invertase Pin-like site-specific DNA recombinase